ncbi:hypothetical protein [Nocardioides yefusunii]|uniref:Uncharacterized protein n=1 Tax=Nocardioides yefusunii TaxID=2500546 RepID=A0ABW1QXQ1_9ACTN|nr:hypothetical protein [Nocardioides yefusunii]
MQIKGSPRPPAPAQTFQGQAQAFAAAQQAPPATPTATRTPSGRLAALGHFLVFLMCCVLVLAACALVWGAMLLAAWIGPWFLPTLVTPAAVMVAVLLLARARP